MKHEHEILAYFFASDESSHKFIDIVFDLHREENMLYMNKIDTKKLSKHIGNIEQEYRFKKLYTIIKRENDDEYDESNVIIFLKKAYVKVNSYVKSTDIISITKFLLRNKKSNMTDARINATLLAIIILADYYDKKIDKDDYAYKQFFMVLYAYDNQLFEEHNVSYNKLTKENKALYRNLELDIKKKYPTIMHDSYLPIEKLDLDTGVMIIDDMSKAQLDVAMFTSIFDLEKITLSDLYGKKYIKSYEIQELIALWHNSKRLELIKNNKDEEDLNIDYEDLYRFLIPAIELRYLLKAYKDSINFFFNNVTDENTLELLSKEKKNREKAESEVKKLENELKGNRAVLSDTIRRYEEKIRILNNKNKKLQEEIDSYPDIKEELYSLRELMFNLNNNKNNDNHNKSTIDINKINDIEGICFGGIDTWAKDMTSILNKWKFISAESINFNSSILKNKKHVFINTVANSHGMYYKVIENKDKDAKIYFVNSINKDRVLNEINEKL